MLAFRTIEVLSQTDNSDFILHVFLTRWEPQTRPVQDHRVRPIKVRSNDRILAAIASTLLCIMLAFPTIKLPKQKLVILRNWRGTEYGTRDAFLSNKVKQNSRARVFFSRHLLIAYGFNC